MWYVPQGSDVATSTRVAARCEVAATTLADAGADEGWTNAVDEGRAGVLGALAGSVAAKAVDGQSLLALFGVVKLVVGSLMLRKRRGDGDPEVRLTMANAPVLLPWLLGVGLLVGLFSGFFGIGGGFLVVPGLLVGGGDLRHRLHERRRQDRAAVVAEATAGVPGEGGGAGERRGLGEGARGGSPVDDRGGGCGGAGHGNLP